MSKDRGEREHTGMMAETAARVLHHLKELAVSYLLLARETARDEAKGASRLVVLTAALVILFAVGATLLAIGTSHLVRTWVDFEGGGPIVTGGGIVVVVLALLGLLLKRG